VVEDNKFTRETDQDGYIKISLVNQGVYIRRKKTSPLKGIPDAQIDYKNIKLLNKYITERGKIVSSRISGIPAKKQRKLSKAIKRARNLALLSFVNKVENV
jgi:small subunit ribosomal protein S18